MLLGSVLEFVNCVSTSPRSLEISLIDQDVRLELLYSYHLIFVFQAMFLIQCSRLHCLK